MKINKICNLFNDTIKDYTKIGSWRVRYFSMKEPMEKLGVNWYEGTEPTKEGINFYHKHFCMDKFLNWMKEFGGIWDLDEHTLYTKEHTFYNEKITNYCIEMSKMADFILTSTFCKKMLYEKMFNFKEVYTIVQPIDTILFDKGEVVWRDLKRAVWFGHEQNLLSLINVVLPCGLDIVTRIKTVEKVSANSNVRFFDIDFKGKINKFLDGGDIVILPYKNDSVKGMRKAQSSDRIVDSLYAGKIVLTNVKEVAEEGGLQDFVTVCDDFYKGIEDIFSNPKEALEKTKAGQDFVIKNYSPEVNAKKWLEVIENGYKRKN